MLIFWTIYHWKYCDHKSHWNCLMDGHEKIQEIQSLRRVIFSVSFSRLFHVAQKISFINFPSLSRKIYEIYEVRTHLRDREAKSKTAVRDVKKFVILGSVSNSTHQRSTYQRWRWAKTRSCSDNFNSWDTWTEWKRKFNLKIPYWHIFYLNVLGSIISRMCYVGAFLTADKKEFRSLTTPIPTTPRTRLKPK